MSTKPKPAAGSKLSPFRILGVVWQGKRIREVWDCRCKCGVFWAVQRDHLMSGRELMWTVQNQSSEGATMKSPQEICDLIIPLGIVLALIGVVFLQIAFDSGRPGR